MNLDNFFTSGWIIEDRNLELRNQFQMTNVAILSSAITLFAAIISNTLRDISSLTIMLEIFLLCADLILFFVLRINKHSLDYVSFLVTIQFTLFFLFLIYVSEPSELKHVWLFTYPIILLYLQKLKHAIGWFIFTFSVFIVAPFQGFIPVAYSVYQIGYLAFALIIIAIITYFYQVKMTEAKDIILAQQNELLSVNAELETQVQELKDKDKILTIQSKQAVMGEMISMIAHQWRQPLSTITLQISNLQLKTMLGEDITSEETYQTLEEISNTIIYLSSTVDDFKTYFHPNKELSEIDLQEILQRTLNFVHPRLKGSGVEIVLDEIEAIKMVTYINELVQVILNLLNNAIDVLENSQKDSPRIIIGAKVEEQNICVSVSDNAGGIDDDILPHIFEPYFSTKGKNGTGLGLYMSQMITQKQFNGTIDVRTSPKGSTFIVKVPLVIS